MHVFWESRFLLLHQGAGRSGKVRNNDTHAICLCLYLLAILVILYVVKGKDYVGRCGARWADGVVWQ